MLYICRTLARAFYFSIEDPLLWQKTIACKHIWEVDKVIYFKYSKTWQYIRNFLVALLFLNAKSSLFLWSKWQIGHRKWFYDTNLFLIKPYCQVWQYYKNLNKFGTRVILKISAIMLKYPTYYNFFRSYFHRQKKIRFFVHFKVCTKKLINIIVRKRFILALESSLFGIKNRIKELILISFARAPEHRYS